ncbi:hypothetical protein IT157_08810 [bacterium]|nr:hypothetical protein [bacterium]
MRTFVILTFMALGLAAKAIAQVVPPESDAPATKLEKLLTSKGTFVVKEFHEMGVIKGSYGSKCTLDAVIVTQPGRESERLRGIKVEITEPSSYSTDSHSSFLDLDELESFIKAIDYCVQLAGQWVVTDISYNEAVFSAKDDFQVGFFQKKREQTGFLKSGLIAGNICFLNSVSDLATIREHASRAQSLLATK